MKKTAGAVKKKSQFRLIVDRFRKNKLAVAGMCIMGLMILVILYATFFCDYQKAITQNMKLRYGNVSTANGLDGLLGYDYMGRSMLWRMIYGGRMTLLASLGVVAISMAFGGLLGAVCGFIGGKFDSIVMRFMDVLQCIPYVMMAMTIVAALGSTILNLVIALALATIPVLARVVRASVLTVREMDYIEAAYVAGSTRLGVIGRHVLPNAIGPIIVYGTMLIANQILSISAMSYLGLGAQPPTPEWGYMISEAGNVLRVYPHLTIVPGIIIILSVLSINLIGDGIQAAVDPKLR